jgi:predicted transcriptional regulator
MTNKMTYAKALEIAMNAVKENKEVYDKLDALKASIAKKNSAERKPTATQKANKSYKTAILEFMEVGKKYTITDLMKEVVELADLSNQRVSALVRQLKEEGLVERTEEKRKAYFSKKVVTDEENEE